jgi:hypothetical protein
VSTQADRLRRRVAARPHERELGRAFLGRRRRRRLLREDGRQRATRPRGTLSPLDPPFVLLFQNISGVKVEGKRRPGVRATELAVTAVANRDVLQHAVDNKIHEYGAGQNAVRHEIPTEPIEAGTDRSANNHDRKAKSRIEVFSSIEVRPFANWTEIDASIGSYGVAERQPQLLTAAAAANRCGCGVHLYGEARVAFRTLGDYLHTDQGSRFQGSKVQWFT